MTPSNIKSGFKKTGIFPFDRDVFTEDEFLVSEVTNRPLTVDDQQPSTSRAVLQAVENQIKSPLEFRDYPRAGPRKNTSKRKKGKSLILTDSPVKNEIEERAQEREENKQRKADKTEKTNNIKKVNIANLHDEISPNKSSDDEMDLPVCTFKTPKGFCLGEMFPEANKTFCW
nr:unnamed protein product [Callosobruchus chinensis]